MEDNPPEETKENAKLIERLQPYSTDASKPERIANASKRFDHSVSLIFDFAEQFGLVDPKTSKCMVPLNIKIEVANPQQWR
jgi:hypothetical protein